MAKAKHSAVGCHVFAGGFTMGMRKHLKVVGQLEIHNFGRETVEDRLGLPFVNANDWPEWENSRSLWKDCEVIYGNPRCTGFSTLTSGYDETIHGASAACTKDIHDLCNFGVRNKFRLVVWESVQQAFTTGRPLLDHLRDKVFVPAGYRVCHLMLNAASFGNAQYRRRYFFVGYRGGNFNIEPPPLLERHTTVGDVIGPLIKRKTRPMKLNSADADYDFDCHEPAYGEAAKAVPFLQQNECLNLMGMRRPEVLKVVSDKLWDTWDDRTSDLPFSLHCLRRLAWDGICPTMPSSCGAFVHPKKDRPLTVGELSALMGWPDGIIPKGPKPLFQIAKGICPEVGEWLAKQCNLFLDGHWGNEDWESSFWPTTGCWEGQALTGSPAEKCFNMTYYAPDKPELKVVQRVAK